MRITVAVFVCIARCAVAEEPAPPVASAAPLDEAKTTFAAARTAFEQGDYETALSLFQRADLLVPAPSLSFDIGATYEHLGRYLDAAAAFERYLALATDDDARRLASELRARVAGDRQRAALQAPPPAPPPPTYLPAFATPYRVHTDRALHDAKKQRVRGIVLVSVGAALLVCGLATAADLAHSDGRWTGVEGGFAGRRSQAARRWRSRAACCGRAASAPSTTSRARRRRAPP
jgi:tetratricopeptide (TPR) repeat protein